MPLPKLIENEDFSLTERVFHTLKQGILSLQIKPKDYLIIGDIAKEYGVSRTPVREALILLEREGWLESDGRRGLRVTVPSSDVILEVIEVQAALEGYVVRRVTPLLDEQDLEQLEQLLTQADKAINDMDEESGRDFGAKFHIYLAEKLGNKRLKEEIKKLEEHVARISPLIWDHAIAPIRTAASQHWQILEAMKEGDAIKAEELMVYHTMWYEKKLAKILHDW
ncbi:GntR family transcriptional regulator [Vacuolonema iberomarrocanum]|uniref:GntR family transcriptional regulator n=1 Tax=Vacuolonema iberomarrocanum TaxID=3454632 RepID=UPI0019F12FC3|nr:GntR family transcriptional regulator [filamentous cyanobacterium LEGE 07170]